MKHDESVYLRHILDAISKISNYVRDDRITLDALSLGNRFFRNALLLLAALLACSCASRYPREDQPDSLKRTPTLSEPESYSATIIQTIEEGDNSQIIETRVARSGALFREEWREAGELRAAITRPDLGRTYLLSINRELYVETNDEAEGSRDASIADSEADPSRYESRGAEPETIEARRLPDSTIDGHICTALERRAVFYDGHSELTRLYSANDLNGLLLRAETSILDTPTPKKILIERKDVRLEVSGAEFTVPSNYKKVSAL